MIERSKLDLWYEGKTPTYDLSSSGLSPSPKNEMWIKEKLSKTSMFNLCEDYGDTRGHKELIISLCEKYSCKPENILITNGASEALYIVLQTFINQKCDIIYQRPYYHELDSLIIQSGNFPKSYELKEENNFKFSMCNLEQNITPNTNLLILNFPNNPTGAVLNWFEYEQIISIASLNNFKILFDEVSADINYQKCPSYIETNLSKVIDNIICINSMSKSFGFAGLRVGWIIASEEFIYKCHIIKEIMSVSSSPLSQFIANELIKSQNRILTENINQVKNNLNYLLYKLKKYKHYISVVIPSAGACCFIKVCADIDIKKFCVDLYNKKSVLITPGSIFGYKDYIRLGLGADTTKFKKAIEIFLDFLLKYIEK